MDSKRMFVYDNEEEAEDMLSKLREHLRTNGELTMAEFIDISNSGQTKTPKDHEYGWDDLDDAKVIQLVSCCYINLPIPKIISPSRVVGESEQA